MKQAGKALGSALGIAGLALILAGAAAPSPEERLARHRNLGKAFYENPTTQTEAVAEFRAALDLAPDSVRERLNYALALLRAGRSAQAIDQLNLVQKRDPALPHTWFNLGVYYKKAGSTEKAIEQFEQMAKLTPQEPIVHYQLGVLYKLQGRSEDALGQFEMSARLNPLLAAAQFQLYNLHRQLGRSADAAQALAAFQRLKKQAEGAASQEDVDWCTYAEIYDPPVAPTPAPEISNPTITEVVLEGTADPRTAGAAAIDSTGTGQTDLLVWSSSGVLLFRRASEPVSSAGLSSLANATFAAPGDFDNDGLMDLCVLTRTGPLLLHNSGGQFELSKVTLPQRRFGRAVWLDYDHDYDLDLILFGAEPALMRNEGANGFSDRTADFPFQVGEAADAVTLRTVPDSKAFDLAVFYTGRSPVLYRDLLGGRYTPERFEAKPPSETGVRADFDADNRVDHAYVSADGKIHVAFDRTATTRHAIRIRLEGVKSLKLAQDAEVEIKAGPLYRKQMYNGYPLVFDTGTFAAVDVVRITWPNGLIQNEVKQPADRTHSYREAQRLSGSCPMIWTWDGKQIEFITDVLGVAPLGASDGDGSYFPVDHDEYVQIPGSALASVGGEYDLRITEELSEVSYLDQVQLYAVDHRAGTEIYTNEKFKGPPYPEFRLYQVGKRVPPVAARDENGRDVREQILLRDGRYPDAFARTQLGVAQQHILELDFGRAAPGGEAVLLLNGWVDWPDGSTFRAASQENTGRLQMPALQMQDGAGRWQTVDPDMGMPAGKPKTIAVRLSFPSASRKLRIVTSLCVYWDEIFLSEGSSLPDVRQREVAMKSAALRFRGFSQSIIHPVRKQPDRFVYESVLPASFWNPTPGMYTRFGDVSGLLREVDDRMAIIGSGDEIRLRFDAAGLPPVSPGWTRGFLLKVDGWAKDRDPNTAFSASVDPLPFHRMTRYPYGRAERYPDDEGHRQYRREYNTRPALRLIRPLDEVAP